MGALWRGIKWIIKVGILSYFFIYPVAFIADAIIWMFFPEERAQYGRAVVPYCMLLVVILAVLTERALPKMGKWLKTSLQEQRERFEQGNVVPDAPVSRPRRPWWQLLPAFFALWGYSAWMLGKVILRIAAWVTNRGQVVLTNYEFTQRGVLKMILLSLPLVVLFWILVHCSRIFRTVGSAAALLLALISILALLGIHAVQSGEDVFSAMIQEEMMLVNLPDAEVLFWGIPSIVLAYYGQDSVLWKAAFWAKWIAFTCILLSATRICGLLRIMTATFLRR